MTALMWGAMMGHIEILDVLIKAGADVNLKGEYNRTALILAVLKGHTEIVKALIEAGADVNAKDNGNMTALDYARDNPKLKGSPVLKRLEQLSR